MLIFSPPPQAGDGEEKAALNVCTISTSKTKQGFGYNSGTAEGEEEKGAGKMMLLGGSAGIKHLFFLVRALVTISFIPKESSCITADFSKWKSLQQVAKGWEVSRFQEINYLSLPISTHGSACSVFPFHQRG